jgi:hypothetical protein
VKVWNEYVEVQLRFCEFNYLVCFKCFQLDFHQKHLDKFEECRHGLLLLLFLIVATLT